MLCMQTTFSKKLGGLASCYLDDSSNKLSFPFFWCAVFCRLSVREPFSDLAFKKFPSELIRWKVVGGIASINILFAEIKAVFLWWKCILRCFANFHLFYSQHCQVPLSGLCWCGTFWMSVRERESMEKNMQLLDLHILKYFNQKFKER